MNALSAVYLGLVVIAIALNIINRRQNNPHWKFMVAYLSLTFISSIVAYAVMKMKWTSNNIFIFHIATPLEYIILGLLFYYTISQDLLRKLILFSIPFFVLMSLFFSLFVQTFEENNSYATILECILITICALLFLRETIALQKESMLQRFPMFWISIGLLFGYVGSLMIEGMLNYLMEKSMDLAFKVYRLGYVIKFLVILVFMIGSYCRTIFKNKWSSPV